MSACDEFTNLSGISSTSQRDNPPRNDDEAENPLPLPPRDRTRPAVQNKPRHQRKHPLILPSNIANPNRWSGTAEGNSNPDSPLSPPMYSSNSYAPPDAGMPPAKPPRVPRNLDDSYDSQIATELEALDDIEDEAALSVASSSSLYQSKDHVSCEDLLDFACDRPNSKRTRGPSQGTDSDEVFCILSCCCGYIKNPKFSFLHR